MIKPSNAEPRPSAVNHRRPTSRSTTGRMTLLRLAWRHSSLSAFNSRLPGNDVTESDAHGQRGATALEGDHLLDQKDKVSRGHKETLVRVSGLRKVCLPQANFLATAINLKNLRICSGPIRKIPTSVVSQVSPNWTKPRVNNHRLCVRRSVWTPTSFTWTGNA